MNHLAIFVCAVSIFMHGGPVQFSLYGLILEWWL